MSRWLWKPKGILAVLIIFVLAGLATRDFTLGDSGEEMNKTIEMSNSVASSPGTTQTATFALG